MKKKFFIIFLLSTFFQFNSYCQNSQVWVKTYGNPGTPEISFDVEVDKSGNIYSTGNYNTSVNFDGLNSVDHGYSSLFLTKSGNNGQCQWLITGGGTSASSQTRTTGKSLVVDDQFIYLSGYYSNGPAYLSGNLLTGTTGSFISKIDTNGTIQWIQCFTSNIACSGKNMVVLSNGDIAIVGDYTQNISFAGGPTFISNGNSDIFIATYSSAGNFKWAKSYGSTNTDLGNGVGADSLNNIYLTGYIRDTTDFGGVQLIPNPVSTKSLYLTKLDSLGNTVWAKRGGYKTSGNSLVVDKDANIYVGGEKDKYNYLVKYDSLGNSLWSKTGTTSFNFSTAINDLAIDKVGNIYAVGSYYMELTMTPYYLGYGGFNNIFVAKFLNNGNLLWLESYQGPNTDFGYGVKLDPYSGNIYVSGQSEPNGSTNYPDAILIRYNVPIITNIVQGRMFIDNNQNGINDSTDMGIKNVSVLSTSLSGVAFTDTFGNYILNLDDTVGQSELIFPQNLPGWSVVTDSAFYTINVTDSLTITDSLDFGFYITGLPVTNYKPSLTGGFPRCNDTVNYWIGIQNLGTTNPEGLIELTLDDSLTYVGASISPDSIINTTYYWSYDSLSFFEQHIFDVQVAMPPFTSMGDTLKSVLLVKELDAQMNVLYSKSDTLKQVSVCAYDPNDKLVLPKGKYSEGFIPNNQELEYLIRFQNTGNDTAITVIIDDVLNNNLDWSSVSVLASSDIVQLSMQNYGELKFLFNNINLPDSGSDFLSSQGFVRFKIDLKPNLMPNTPIYNTANIYFDNNPPIITNTVLNTIDTTSLIVFVNQLINRPTSNVVIYPNPFNSNINLVFDDNLLDDTEISIFDLMGKELLSINSSGQNKLTIDLSKLKKGVYLIRGVNAGKMVFVRRIVAQ